MSPQERDDELLGEYLEGDSSLSRLYRRGANEKPGAQLDARILGEARRALAQKGRAARSPFARNWMVSTSLAALFVLSVSVVLLMPDPDNGPGVEVDGATQLAPAGATMRDAPGDATRVEQVPVPASVPPALEADRRREHVPDVDDSAGAGSASGLAPRQPPAIKQGAAGASRKTEEQRRAVSAERKHIDNGAAQSLPEPAAAASVAEEAAAPEALERSREPARASQATPSQFVRDDPQAWLRFIEALLDDQNRAEAQSNLRAFTHRYPGFPLPESLADLAASLDARPP